MPVVESLLTIPDVAKLAKLSRKTIERMMKRASTPEPVRIGTGRRRQVRMRASDVHLWLSLGAPDRTTFEAAKRERGEVSP